MVPIENWAQTRLRNLNETDRRREISKVDSGFGKNIPSWLNQKMVYPDNALYLATECNNKNYSAAFPDALPEWFIQLLTEDGDVVLDLLIGSGRRLFSKRMERSAIGFDVISEYVELVKTKLQPYGNCLFDLRKGYGKNNFK